MYSIPFLPNGFYITHITYAQVKIAVSVYIKKNLSLREILVQYIKEKKIL